ncbi:MAG: hypothetical protein HUU35_11520 [Armatimonadetes bacterium]|nr:hypothetical protein [Armatimonadota bacterium]
MRTVGGVTTAGGMAFVVVSEAEQPLVAVLATDEPHAAAGHEPQAEFEALRRQAPYALVVSPAVLRLYDSAGEALGSLATAAVLTSYHRGFRDWRATPRYLVTLVEAWLSDLAYGWRDEPPPGEALLESVGLVALLRGGALHVMPDEQGNLRP